ncbi:hypothetical protein ANMWB30_24950 [Arthrobacter sp. MWB30]|nr:hypothetical protein ANMWB30_24950 [Arthrobacter sp. MWB30]
MTADSTEELIAFAVGLGLRADYIQHPGTWKEHFDVTETKRRLAVRKGAVEVSYRDHVMHMATRRGQRPTTNTTSPGDDVLPKN